MGDSYLSSKTALDNITCITFPELLRKWSEKCPNKIAFIFIDMGNEGHEFSFGELYDKAITYLIKVLCKMEFKRTKNMQ